MNKMSMLPKTFPAFPNRKDIELYAALVPAKAVGRAMTTLCSSHYS